MKIPVALLLSGTVLLPGAALAEPQSETLLLNVGGRVETTAGKIGYKHQWPGIYFEGQFKGESVDVETDDTGIRYKVWIDGKLHMQLVDMGHQTIQIGKLGSGPHTIRIEKVSESQTLRGAFNRIRVHQGQALPITSRTRQIEFIGDSFTVGYGNTSPKRECTKDEVWATTDTSQAFVPMTAKHFDADYQLNAFSGRGVVRNYDGFQGDTLPVLHKYVLFDGQTEYHDPSWQPQLIVIGLGTNDFSTPLNPGEKWKTREDLRADYHATYVAFVQRLRAQHPKAQFLLMASDQAGGEIRDQVAQVAQTLKAKGEKRIDTLFFSGLDYGGCDYHPSLADHKTLQSLLTGWIDARPDIWAKP